MPPPKPQTANIPMMHLPQTHGGWAGSTTIEKSSKARSDLCTALDRHPFPKDSDFQPLNILCSASLRMSGLQSGIYQLYWSIAGANALQPLGIDTVDGQPPQVVQFPVGHAAPLWTITKVGTDTFTFSVGGTFIAPSSIWIVPSSTAYPWKVQNRYTAPTPGGESENYVVWTNDGTRGWNYLVLGGRRDMIPRQPPGELLLYLESGTAVPWWFKRVA